MNKNQRRVLYVCSAVIVLMVLFPPTKVVYEGAETYGGYRFLLSLRGVLMVHSGQLIAQVVSVTCVALLLCKAFKSR